MAEIKYRKVKKRVMLDLSLTEARYLYSVLSRCDPYPEDLFGPEYLDPIYDALADFLLENGINNSTGLATVPGHLL